MLTIKAEHTLLTIDDLLDNYVAKRKSDGFVPDQKFKDIWSKGKINLKGEKKTQYRSKKQNIGQYVTFDQASCNSIYYLPQLLAKTDKELRQTTPMLGEAIYNLLKAAVIDLGYEIGQFSNVDEIIIDF